MELSIEDGGSTWESDEGESRESTMIDGIEVVKSLSGMGTIG